MNKTNILASVLFISILIAGEIIIQPVIETNLDLRDQISQLVADKIGMSQELIETKVSLSTELKERVSFQSDMYDYLTDTLESDIKTANELSKAETLLRGKQIVIIEQSTYDYVTK